MRLSSLTLLKASFGLHKSYSFPKAIFCFSKSSFGFATQKFSNKPQEFSLEDFEKLGKSNKSLNNKDFIQPITFFNNILKENKNLKIDPEAVKEKLESFLIKLEKNLYAITKLNDLHSVFLFCRTLNIESLEFWSKFFSHTLSQTNEQTINANFFNDLTNLLSFSNEKLRIAHKETIKNIIEKNFFVEKYNFYTLSTSVQWLYKWLIFRVGYDLALKLDAKDKTVFDNYITPEFFNQADKLFPAIRRNFQGLSLTHKIYALTVYSALYHNTTSEQDIKNILKRVSNSILNNVNKLSSLQLVMLTQIFIRSNYDHPEFWKALEKYILSRLETDFSINYLVKYLQGFTHFNAGSLDLYMEIDRYIGFHSEELTAQDIPAILKVFTESQKARQKLFELMEVKIFEFKNDFKIHEFVEFFHFYAINNYMTPKLSNFLEAKILAEEDSLTENSILKIIDALRIMKKKSSLFESLKSKIHEIIKTTESENSLLCITAAYLEDLQNENWYNDLSERTKSFINKKNSTFLLKLGGLLIKVSSKIFDDEFYKIFGNKYKELEKDFIGNDKKDIHFILWKLGMRELI